MKFILDNLGAIKPSRPPSVGAMKFLEPVGNFDVCALSEIETRNTGARRARELFAACLHLNNNLYRTAFVGKRRSANRRCYKRRIIRVVTS